MVRKVILSRKGFDGTTGGKPSPVIDGKLMSLPIPRADSGFFYKDLAISPQESYLKIMMDLGIRLYSETHLDPDLLKSIMGNRSNEWRGLFGQGGNSQGTLYNRDVGKGDIFLFFGWFKEVSKINGIWKYVPNAPEIHAVFGYLEVDQAIDIRTGDSVPTWAKYHPHIKDRNTYGNQRNTVYFATPTFTKNVDKPGWGCFDFNKRLVLTKTGEKNKSYWELPSCFQNEQDNFTHNINTWNVLPNGRIEMQTLGRGDQEVYIGGKPEVVEWAEKLIGDCSSFQ
ncbi:hypothetical protein [Virgibacillus salinus]|uniref:Nucleotide modification associated domain-containing protein n=1 Tax=Virgibacillus salinus TaxID=553311 RepID=A0A1H1GH16_9BACI|nr:hypothetical protein [Virgibacillus salinus]SDR12467.1 hypothetical protein SAMN05216231_3719 [Virgibacillus salinus]